MKGLFYRHSEVLSSNRFYLTHYLSYSLLATCYFLLATCYLLLATLTCVHKYRERKLQ